MERKREREGETKEDCKRKRGKEEERKNESIRKIVGSFPITLAKKMCERLCLYYNTS